MKSGDTVRFFLPSLFGESGEPAILLLLSPFMGGNDTLKFLLLLPSPFMGEGWGEGIASHFIMPASG